MSVRRILVIAGSDSSGGAGLEADQKVIAAHGCYAMTATTALTAQNTQGVYGIHETPPKFLQMQIEACIDDVGVDVVKTGMLASAEAISVVADAFRRYHIQKIVVDPVMVATTGARLLPQEAVQTLHKEILPITTVLTPNIPEAKLLLELAGKPVPKLETREDMVEIAKAVQSLGPKYVLLKGGHHPFVLDGSRQANDLEEGIILDVLFGDGQATCLSSKFIHTKNTHGTGCSLASAVACCLSKGMDVPESARAACRYVEAGIKLSLPIGKGHGPINHFHSLYSLPFAPGRFVEYLLARADVQEAWKLHTEHEFVNRLADGTLPLTAFKQYLIQDYLYLIQFARANALAAYKARTMDDITMSANIVGHIQREMSLHIDFCKGFGLSKEDMENEKESQACVAYTRYVLDVGQSGDWLGLQISLAPCLIGYGHIARRLHDDPKTLREGNIYWKWIENYVADDYVEAVRVGSELLEKHAVEQSPKRIEELVEIFIEATKMEAGFWDMGYGDKL